MSAAGAPRAAPGRRGLSPAETSLLGCGAIALAAFAAVGASVYFARRNLAFTTDAAIVRGWLKDEIGSSPVLPKGYDALGGFRGNALGQTLLLAIVGPPGAATLSGRDFTTDPARTTFQIVRVQMADAAKIDDEARAKLGEAVAKSEDHVFKVGELQAKGSRREIDSKGGKLLEFQLALRKNLMFLARGPRDGFDRQAMDDFLLTLPLDAAWDLPTRVAKAEAKTPAK